MKNNNHLKCNQILKTIGDYWTLMIIMELAKGECRFCKLQRAVGNINPVTLTNRLKKLNNTKFINRKEESIDKLSVIYILSKKGKKLLPVLDEIQKFSSRTDIASKE